MLDKRSYRGPNTANRQTERSAETALLGDVQFEWLKRKLKESRATWKVMCSDMPIGLVVHDGEGTFDNAANGNGPPLGRELEIAELLRFAKEEKVRNMVWLTADVHYAAAHHYDPERARFREFDPFWEFVAGPLNAGTFGPGQMDDTFGPQVKWHSLPRGMKGGRPPSAGLQFFGTVRVDGKTEAMTVSFYNAAGRLLHTVELEPVRA
jgi:alkaline phosphatase D